MTIAENKEASKLCFQKVNGKILLTLTKNELIKKIFKILRGSALNLAETIEKLKVCSGIESLP
jgi:hypothetical protein